MENKNNHGGVRIPGPGKQLGKPPKITGGKTRRIYYGDKVQDILASIHETPSEALRIMADFWELHHPKE